MTDQKPLDITQDLIREVSDFDVMQEMSNRNLDIRLAPLGNITNLQKTKAGTLVTIGVAGDLVAAIGIHGKFLGGLFLCDKQEFQRVKRELQERQEESRKGADQ